MQSYAARHQSYAAGCPQYVPTGTRGSVVKSFDDAPLSGRLSLVTPPEVRADNLQPIIGFGFYGAVAAAWAVLPSMREPGAGTLRFATGGGSVDPVPVFGDANVAQAALRNWVINLNKELAGSGVHAARVVGGEQRAARIVVFALKRPPGVGAGG